MPKNTSARSKRRLKGRSTPASWSQLERAEAALADGESFGGVVVDKNTLMFANGAPLSFSTEDDSLRGLFEIFRGKKSIWRAL